MKILFISEYFYPKVMGGGEVNLHLLAKALVKKNNEVSILTSHHSGLKKNEIIDGIKIYRTLKTGSEPSGLCNNFKRSHLFPKSAEREIKKIAKNQDFDLIHFIGASVIAAAKLKELNIPLFATVESYPALCPKGDRIYHGRKECQQRCTYRKFISCQLNSSEIGKTKNSWYLKYNLPLLSYIFNYFKKVQLGLKYCNLISISEYVKKILEQHGLSSTVIPNALEIDFFKPKNQVNTQKGGKIKVLYLGALIRSKGPHILLQAIKGIDCHCNLYGAGIMKEELLSYIKDNNLDATIHHPVPYHQVPNLYHQSDIVVFPSLWPEPFGRIAIEAMAAGTPVIASTIGGIKETVEQGAGLLVKAGDIKELKEKISLLISSPELRKKISKEGQNKVKSFNETSIIDKLIKIYSEKIEK